MIVISRRQALILTAGLVLVRPSPALAAEYKVEMLNKHPEDKKKRNVFLPTILTVQPGDMVTFVPTNNGHNSASTKGMIPEGAEPWKGKVNKEISVTFEKPGFYGYQCTPHVALGMVGLVIVEGEGKLDNLEAAKAVKQRGKAKKAWQEIWAQAEAEGLLVA